MAILEFSARESTAQKAVVVSLDLVGFSTFCNQPEASIMIPRLTKALFDLLNSFFAPQSDLSPLVILKSDKLAPPNFIKFTGDGALMFWVQEGLEDFPQGLRNRIVLTMREFQKRAASELPLREKEWCVHRLPKRVRVGIATGIVYALRPPHAFLSITQPSDFVGYCVNLAVRLQGHCSDLGFLVHGDLHPELSDMELYQAIQMKGTQAEPVALFKEDVCRVLPSVFTSKFEPA